MIARPAFIREPQNPILSAKDWPYPVNAVFNPGVTRLPDGRVLLLCRCEDFRGHSHFTKAISEDGIQGWVIDPEPTFAPDFLKYPEELWGVEDPRITRMDDDGTYIVSYTAFSRKGPGISIFTTQDWVTFDRCGLIMRPDDKDGAVFPKRFGGRYAMIHRPSREGGADMWLSYGTDLLHWGESERWMKARSGAWWDARKIGLCGPPIETPEGWLVFYHGVRQHASGSIYRVGAALFELENPSRAIARGDEWLMGPEEPYELVGDVGSVIFPCGNVLEDNGDTISLYYGGADTSISMARCSLSEVVRYLKNSEQTYSLELSTRYHEDVTS